MDRYVLKRIAKRNVRAWLGPLPEPERWAFIVACSNSGTTLLHSLLARHPDVGSLPAEGQFLTDQLPTPKREGFGRRWAVNPELYHLTERDGRSIRVRRLKRQWGYCFNDPTMPVLIEKSPPNAARTRWLQAHFANAHFIGLIRYAVAEGISRRAGHPISLAATQWARSNELLLADWPYLERKVLMRYEDLASDTEASLRELFRFLKLDVGRYDWSALRRPMKIHEREERVSDLNANSLAALSNGQRAEIDRAASPMLERLGYLNGSAQGRAHS
jgi:hypothetical protein